MIYRCNALEPPARIRHRGEDGGRRRVRDPLPSGERDQAHVKPRDQAPITLDHVVIAVSDWGATRDFYGRVLRAEFVARPDAGFRMRFGLQQLNVHGPGASAAPVARIPVAPGGADLCFQWQGPIEDAIAHLAENGVVIEEGPVPRGGAQGAGTSVYFRDPDGNLLEFICYSEATV